MDEKYTVKQIVEAIMKAGYDAVMEAIAWHDKDMLEDVIKDFLN